MTLKSKISLSLGFLFSIILVLGGLGAFYLNRLSEDSKAILEDNYISLEFVSNMHRALITPDDPDALIDFDVNLKKQESNITEVGEQQATNAVRREFTRLRSGATNAATINRIRQNLFVVDDLNRQAIVRKSRTAEQTAKDALIWLGFVGTLSFLVVLSFVINIPSYIANPVRELTRGIKQVASRNFEERLNFRSSDEFGELARSFNSMAQKLDEYEHSSLAQVLFEKKRIDTLVEIMPDGIIGLDEKRRILFINPVAERLLGVERQQLVGKYAPDVATSNDLLRLLIQDIMAGPTRVDSPPASTTPGADAAGNLLKIYDPGATGKGKESYFTKQIQAVEVTPTGETQPVHAGYVIVLQNITSYKELDVAKTNFIATVSHELKTPISAIKMSLKLLLDERLGSLNDEQREMVGHVQENADRLLRLTGEILNMAQVESGQIELHIQPVNPVEIVQVAVNALRTQAEQKQVSFALTLPPELPAVKADPDKASWVLVNFLSNAVRHSPDQSSIDVTARQVGDQVEFTVRDYGPGLRPEHRERVFDRYFKAPGLNGQLSGTGLGLAICKEFIQSMGGQIGLDSDVEPGAAFSSDWQSLKIPPVLPNQDLSVAFLNEVADSATYCSSFAYQLSFFVMKGIHKLLSTLMLCLPLLCISWLWDRLPTRLPVHFTDDGLPDRFASRQEWFSGLLNVMFALVLIRGVIIALLSRRFDVQGGRFVRIYLLSSAFVGSILGLMVLCTVYLSSQYTDLLPVLMALFGAAGVYFTVPADLSTAGETDRPAPPPSQIAALQHMHTLSRSTVIRVNLLAALLMLFARGEDRWTIGVMANLLAFATLTVIGIIRRQSS